MAEAEGVARRLRANAPSLEQLASTTKDDVSDHAVHIFEELVLAGKVCSAARLARLREQVTTCGLCRKSVRSW